MIDAIVAVLLGSPHVDLAPSHAAQLAAEIAGVVAVKVQNDLRLMEVHPIRGMNAEIWNDALKAAAEAVGAVS